jgi:hypothetical protein
MFDWFKEAAIKKGMSNIRNDTEKLIEAAKAAESRVSLTGYMHGMDQARIRRLQNSLVCNIKWAVSVGVSESLILSQIQSVLVRVTPSNLSVECLERVFNIIGSSHE